ncbi:hypothetical protein BDD12DRAFT_982660 [Trichophaea hybrida]|nr:hypothetical protein BDD12DRAFT_982660 [Trichophaea hybrida]
MLDTTENLLDKFTYIEEFMESFEFEIETSTLLESTSTTVLQHVSINSVICQLPNQSTPIPPRINNLISTLDTRPPPIPLCPKPPPPILLPAESELNSKPSTSLSSPPLSPEYDSDSILANQNDYEHTTLDPKLLTTPEHEIQIRNIVFLPGDLAKPVSASTKHGLLTNYYSVNTLLRIPLAAQEGIDMEIPPFPAGSDGTSEVGSITPAVPAFFQKKTTLHAAAALESHSESVGISCNCKDSNGESESSGDEEEELLTRTAGEQKHKRGNGRGEVVVKEEAVVGGKKLVEDQERILEENGQCQILNHMTRLLARKQSK